MTIRWTIKDRATGERLNPNHPGPHAGSTAYGNLSSIVEHCSSVKIVDPPIRHKKKG